MCSLGMIALIDLAHVAPEKTHGKFHSLNASPGGSGLCAFEKQLPGSAACLEGPSLRRMRKWVSPALGCFVSVRGAPTLIRNGEGIACVRSTSLPVSPSLVCYAGDAACLLWAHSSRVVRFNTIGRVDPPP